MNFERFTRVDFPPQKDLLHGPPEGFVYVFFWAADGIENPFYVGQTKRLSGRMRDYHLKIFTACTDFRVGEAIETLRLNSLSFSQFGLAIADP